MEKYTYQDWLDGKVSNPLSENFSEKDFDLIRKEQKEACLKWLKNGFESMKNGYAEFYDTAILPELQLEKDIANTSSILSELQESIDEVYFMLPLLFDVETLSPEFSRERVVNAQLYDLNTRLPEEAEIMLFNDLFYKKKKFAPFAYVVHSYFLKWLQWFQKEKIQENKEPAIPKATRGNYKESINTSILARRNFSWESLFIDPEQAATILALLSEHLSSTGQWLTAPKGRYLVALCTELESKGYFKSDNTISNPVKALAFNTQFGVNLSTKNFQPEERNKAEDYREHFKKHIPPYTPTLSA